MSVNTRYAGKVHRIETIYRQGFQSDLIDRALTSLIDLEQSRVRRETRRYPAICKRLSRNTGCLRRFYTRYEAGKLEDSADFMEWSSFIRYACIHQRYTLAG